MQYAAIKTSAASVSIPDGSGTAVLVVSGAPVRADSGTGPRAATLASLVIVVPVAAVAAASTALAAGSFGIFAGRGKVTPSVARTACRSRLGTGVTIGGAAGRLTTPLGRPLVVMASPAKGVDPAPKLGQLKGMLQNGLIEQSDYDERKRQLLDGMILEEFDDVLAIADRALAGAAASGLSPTGSLGAGLEVEPSVLLKTARARVLVKPLDEDLDPWDRQRWWESEEEDGAPHV